MAREQFDLIVFDWDGTLMDSTAHITRSIQAACRDLARTVAGPGSGCERAAGPLPGSPGHRIVHAGRDRADRPGAFCSTFPVFSRAGAGSLGRPRGALPGASRKVSRPGRAGPPERK